MGSSSTLIIERLTDRISILSGVLEGGVVRVERAFAVDVPEDVGSVDCHEYGRWLRTLLKTHGLSARRVWIGLGRSEVITKPLEFETVEDPDADLPGMVRLQMARQLSIPIEESVVDYTVVPHDHNGGWHVIAGATPESRVQWWRDAVKGAGLSLVGLGPVDTGIALLGAPHELDNNAPTLIAVPACGQLEITIAHSGAVLFTRSIPLGVDAIETGTEGLQRRLHTEIRRAWTSYRVTSQAHDVGSVLVLGEEEIASRLAERCAEAMAIPGFGVSSPSLLNCTGIGVGTSDATPGDEAEDIARRLGGLILASHAPSRVMNFASPRRAPDRGARKRQLAMLAMLLVILVVGAVLTLGIREVRGLSEQVELLQMRCRDAEREAARSAVELARLAHINVWRETEVAWLDHLDAVRQSLPGTDQLLLDRVTAKSSAGITYDKRGRRRSFDPEYLSSRVGIEIDISGRAISREVAEQFRGAFVADPRYLVRPVGDDGRETNDPRYPYAFAFRLLTTSRVLLDVGGDDPEASS